MTDTNAATEVKKVESEFGKGLTYCLGLFLAHAERANNLKKIYAECRLSSDWPSLWFNGASDHFYELEIPSTLPESLKARLTQLQEKSLKWGHGYRDEEPTEADVNNSIDEAKELLRLIDEHFGVSTIEATWK